MNKYIIPLMIFGIIFLFWNNSLFIGFLNDDYQIVGKHNPDDLWDCLRIFTEPDVLVVYWRPFVNFIHSFTILIFGFNPFVFHFENLIIYSLCCYLLFILLKKTGISEKNALISVIFFSVLSSHELQAAWLSGRNESIMAVNILLSAICYFNFQSSKKKIFFALSLAAFLLAVLTKELSFIGILIPVFGELLPDYNKKQTEPITKIIKRMSLNIIPFVLVLSAVYIYRTIVIGGNPFQSPHFSNISFFTLFENFIAYIPLSLITAGQLEITVTFLLNNLYLSIPITAIIVISIIVISIIYAIVKIIRTEYDGKNGLKNIFAGKYFKQILFGAVWFVVFILPALPNLMRWYSFTASFGLMVILGAVLEMLSQKDNYRIIRIYFISILFALTALFISLNYKQMDAWLDASEKVTEIIDNLKNLKTESYKRVFLWGAPDKINKVGAMKIGTQEIFQWGTGNNQIDVVSPLRLEMDYETKVEISRKAPNQFILSAINSRFLPFAARSRSIIIDETFSIDDEIYSYKINTLSENASSLPITFAEVTIKDTSSENLHLYYDGVKFVKINN